MAKSGKIKYNYIVFSVIFIILFFSCLFQKVYANNTAFNSGTGCKLIKSKYDDSKSFYYYTDSGEMAEYNIPNTEFLNYVLPNPMPKHPYIKLYDAYENEITKFSCILNEDYDTCKKENPVKIESYYDNDGNKVISYKDGKSKKSELLSLYVVSPNNQKIEIRHKTCGYGLCEVQMLYNYNSKGQIEFEYFTFNYEKYNKKQQIRYKKNYIYDKNNNLIKKEIECINCNEKLKNNKFYQIYSYNENDKLITEETYIPKLLTGKYYIYDNPVIYKALNNYEYDKYGNIIKEIKFISQNENMSYTYENKTLTYTYKYDKYGNKIKEYLCENQKGNSCKLIAQNEYDCK